MILPFIIVSKTLLVLSFLPNLSLAAPAQNIDVQSHALDKRADKPSQGQIDSANGMFPGIDWNYSAEQGGCDSGQFAILVEATRMALEMMEFTGERLQLAFDTTGFNRYFMRHKEWYKQSVYRFAEYKYLMVKQWPRTEPSLDIRDRKTVYWCVEPNWMDNHCDNVLKPPAYTPRVGKQGTADPTYPYANSVMFCPKFWGGQFRYVNEITEKANRTLANIDDYNSYEHVLIHEWFHNSKTDQPGWHITDIVGDYITGFGSIYRSFACQHFAWRHVLKGGGVGDIEKETMLNADNWAWMFSYNWYKSIYNWKDNGSMKMGDFKLKGRDDEEEDPEAEEDPNKGAPIDPDGEDESTITIPGEYLTPEATTFDPEICIGCIVTTGGCFAAADCRFPQADGTVDKECTHCTCDINKNDNIPTVVQISLKDERCGGYTGKLPNDYKWPLEIQDPDDFHCNCDENGCTADSLACCANASCECHCGESSCGKDDPSCCANGSCKFGTMSLIKDVAGIVGILGAASR